LIFVTLAHLDSWKNVLKENEKEEKVMKKWVVCQGSELLAHNLFLFANLKKRVAFAKYEKMFKNSKKYI